MWWWSERDYIISCMVSMLLRVDGQIDDTSSLAGLMRSAIPLLFSLLLLAVAVNPLRRLVKLVTQGLQLDPWLRNSVGVLVDFFLFFPPPLLKRYLCIVYWQVLRIKFVAFVSQIYSNQTSSQSLITELFSKRGRRQVELSVALSNIISCEMPWYKNILEI